MFGGARYAGRFKVSPPCQRPLVPETAPERGQHRHHRRLSREPGGFPCHLALPAHLRWLCHSGEPGRRFPGRCRDLRSARPAGRSSSDSSPRSGLEIQKRRFRGRRFPSPCGSFWLSFFWYSYQFVSRLLLRCQRSWWLSGDRRMKQTSGGLHGT